MSPKKKIIVCTTSYLPFIGGAEIAVQEVGRRLCDTFDFFIITARQRSDLRRREDMPEGTVIRVGFGSRVDKWLLPFTGMVAIAKLAYAGEIPGPWKQTARESLLIWGMDISQGAVLGFLFKIIFSKIPFVCTVQYGDGEARLARARGGFIGLSFRHILRSADAVTAISSYLINTARADGFVGAEKMIPNGVDTSLFEFRNADFDAKRSEEGKHVVITTSRLVKKNAVDVLIRAVAEVKKTIPPIKCYVIGDGPERDALEKLVKELELSRDIIFLGGIPYEEIPFYLRKADVFVRASRSEGMGNSFVEALSVGIPIIGTRVGGIPDIIIDGKTGIFCNVDDPHDLAEKILMLLNDDTRVLSMRNEGRNLVEEKFSWNAIGQSYGDLFKKLLAVRKRILIATPLYPPEIGGPATYAHILTNYLLDAGIATRVLRFSEVRVFPKIARHAIYFFKALARARGCDYILALDPVSVGFPAMAAAFILCKPFVVKIVGDYAWEQGMQRFGVTELLDDFLKKSYGGRIGYLCKIEYVTARHAQGIIVPSEYLKRVVMAWGIQAEKIQVIANAEELEIISESREDIRKKLSLLGTILISAGRLVPWKGFNILIELMPEIIRSHSDAMLFIVGSGPQKERLESLITAKGLNERIKLLGAITHRDLLKFMKASDAFVLATAYEGLSHVILEAMAMGTLVVTSNVGGNPELVEHRTNGFLFHLDDRENIIRIIQEALALPEDKRRIIRQAAITQASRYTPERMVHATANYMLHRRC